MQKAGGLLITLIGISRVQGYSTSKMTTRCADVISVPMFSDNYGHILIDRATNQAACIDPAEPGPVDNKLKELKVDMKMLLITHKHNDHIGGNQYFANKGSAIQIIGPRYEPIPYITQPVSDQDTFMLGSLTIKVFHTPCHTSGHIVYYVTGAEGTTPVLFTGDTLFVGGCGRFFEGTATEMLANMDLFASLPRETTFYCAHEYTEANYKFLAAMDAEVCGGRYAEVQEMRRQGLSTVPSTLGAELDTNLFMKCREPRTQKLVGAMDSPVETMGMLRKMKNEFK